jgi:phenylacetate-coenzyme A ligase PaaK-like adenylate-forming protein
MIDQALEQLISAPQFQMRYAEKQQVLLPLLLERARHCADHNELLRKHNDQLGFESRPLERYEDLPYLPVAMFKEFDLATVPPERVMRTLLSSATTTGTPSRIPLDKGTSKRQAQGLAAILKDVLGSRRRPFLVLDCAEINRPGHQLTARGAAVRGLMPFASEIAYALVQTESGLEPDLEIIERFFAAHAGQEVLLFGFTFMVWSDLVLKLRQRGVRFAHPELTLLHSGGWKKLTEQRVDKTVFAAGIAETFGCEPGRVRDFYGMVEQVGVVFVDCEAGHKHTPAFAEVAIRDFDSLRQVEIGGSGLIQVMSLLPESYPGYALITEDVGELLGYDDCPCGRHGLYFRFRSRVEQVEVRGCGDTVATSRTLAATAAPKSSPALATPDRISWLAGLPPSSDEPAQAFAGLRERLLAGPGLSELPAAAIVGLLDDAGQRMLNADCRGIEGLAFLTAWLRRGNLERVLRTNFGDKRDALDRPVADAGSALRAAPRGLVGHWVAGNVPTLALFSWALATLGKNPSILRISRASVEPVRRLFAAVAEARYAWQGQEYGGADLLARTSVLHFPREATTLNTALSLTCDARVIWGGGEAVRAVRALDTLEHCEDLVFGPKFSLVAADRRRLGDPQRRLELARSLAREVAAFEQAACSSPQILFLEGSIAEHGAWLGELHAALAEEQRRAPRTLVSETAAARILRLRASYGLTPEWRVLASPGTEHSLLAADGAELVEAVQARTLFVRGLERLDDCLPLLSPKIQTLGLAIDDPGLRAAFAEAAARQGVSRCVPVGTMNYFETPWDGMLPVSRLVRWVRLPAEEKIP